MRKIISSLLFLFLVTIVLPPVSFANTTFKDVPANAEYVEHLQFVNSKNFISGYDRADGTYLDPSGVVKRSHVAKILIEATNTSKQGKSIYFSDLPNNEKYKEAYTYLSRAVELGWLQSDRNNAVRPFEPITREEMAYAIAQAFNYNVNISTSKPYPFADQKETDPDFTQAIHSLYYEGVVRGEHNKFDPKHNLKRNQFIMIVARAMDQSKFGLANEMPASFQHGVVNVDRNDTLNVRQQPSVSSSVLGALQPNASVTILNETTNGWFKIKYGASIGYVAKAYVKQGTPSKPEVEGPTPSTGTYVKITSVPAPLHVDATTQSKQLIEYWLDHRFEVLEIKGDWVKVDATGDLVGYIHKSKLTFENAVDPTIPVLPGIPGANSSVAGKVIVLDPGHGGSDPGAIFGSAREKDITLSVAKLVEQKLKRDGAQVKMTRSTDTFVSLDGRVNFTKRANADSFISIHVNSANASSANGTETFFSTQLYAGDRNKSGKKSRDLAIAINNAIKSEVKIPSRGVKDMAFYVLRKNDIPSVLVELAFITNANDRQKLTNPAYQERFAEAIYQGIVEFHRNN